MVADAFQVPGTLLGSEDITVDQRDKIPPSWSLHSSGRNKSKPQNGCVDLSQSRTQKAFDNCKHALNVCYCCSEVTEVGMRN